MNSEDIEVGHPLIPDAGHKYLYGSTKPVKERFARKVYGIIAAQLSLTFAVAAAIGTQPLMWIMDNTWIFFASMMGTFLLVFGLLFFPNIARRVPYNYIYLALFTLLESVMVGFCSSIYDIQSVLIAAGATAGIFLVLTVFVVTTKLDLTGLLPYLITVSFSLIFFGAIAMLLPAYRGVQLVYGFAGATLFSLYIVVDTQMIFRGEANTVISYTVDDYIFAALAVYIDIIGLFVNLLSLVGNRHND